MTAEEKKKTSKRGTIVATAEPIIGDLMFGEENVSEIFKKLDQKIKALPIPIINKYTPNATNKKTISISLSPYFVGGGSWSATYRRVSNPHFVDQVRQATTPPRQLVSTSFCR